MNIIAISLPINELISILTAIILLVSLANILGNILTKFCMPRVVGEIFAGIILGPSLLGSIAPEFYNSIFYAFPEEPKILGFFYWIGLITLMISTGFKFNSHTVSSPEKKVIVTLLLGSTILPILGGYVYYNIYDFSIYKGNQSTDSALFLVIAISIAITSIPVISKIFIDLNIVSTKFAQIILTTAVIHDLVLWIALDVAIKESSGSGNNAIFTAFTTLIFLILSIIVSRILKVFSSLSSNSYFNPVSAISINFSISLIMIILVYYLQIHIVFGALVSGILIGSINNIEFKNARNKICDFSLAFFIPIYFAIVGVKINLPSYFELHLFVMFFLISSFLEIVSVFLGMKIIKKDSLSSLNFGVAMNTRGGPGIVVASIALEHGIINEKLFVALILTAIMTSLLTGAWFKFILDKKLPLYAEDKVIKKVKS